MIWIVIAALAAVSVFLVWYAWKNANSTQHLQQLAQGFPVIQQNAFNNVDAADKGIAPIEGNQYLRTIENFGVAYTVAHSPDGLHFIHHISGKAPTKPEKFVIESMLLVMLTLLSQFKAANLTEEPQLNIERSELGTHHLEFQLTAQQHHALHKAVRSSLESPPAGSA